MALLRSTVIIIISFILLVGISGRGRGISTKLRKKHMKSFQNEDEYSPTPILIEEESQHPPFLNDVVYPPKMKQPTSGSGRAISFVESGLPAVVEVLYIVDHRAFTSPESDFSDLTFKRYLLSMTDKANRYFKALKDVKVKLKYNGMYIFKNSWEQTWLNNLREIYDSPVGKNKTLVGFHNWMLAYGRTLPDHDVAILLIYAKSTYSEVGNAALGGVCQVGSSSGLRDYFAAAFIEDMYPNYTGVLALAHYIGHLLGAPHDSTRECYSPNNVMQPLSKLSIPRPKWSACSESAIENHLDDPRSRCVWETTEPTLGSKIPTIRQQCVLQTGFKDSNLAQAVFQDVKAGTPDEFCEKVPCSIYTPNVNIHKQNQFKWIRPREGTSCYPGKYCKYGKCSYP